MIYETQSTIKQLPNYQTAILSVPLPFRCDRCRRRSREFRCARCCTRTRPTSSWDPTSTPQPSDCRSACPRQRSSNRRPEIVNFKDGNVIKYPNLLNVNQILTVLIEFKNDNGIKNFKKA